MNPGSFALVHPQWLWLLAALAGVALLGRRKGRAQDDTGLSSGGGLSHITFIHPLAALLAGVATRSRGQHWVRTLVTWLSLGGLVLALAQPVRVGEKLPDPPRDRDILFIVDVSVSMTLRDYTLDGERIARLEVLKGLLDRFVQRMAGDRISVIVFAQSAHTLVPLTRDPALVRRMLTRIDTGIAGRYEAVGEAVALAVKEAGRQPARRQVLVLLTDAFKPTGAIDADAAAELAAQAGLPLYTVSIGAGDLQAGEQRVTGLIYQPVDVALLQRLAQRTGAQHFHAEDSRALERALERIEQREQDPVEPKPRYYREPLYHWPLLAALLLLTSAQLFGNLAARWGRRV